MPMQFNPIMPQLNPGIKAIIISKINQLLRTRTIPTPLRSKENLAEYIYRQMTDPASLCPANEADLLLDVRLNTASYIVQYLDAYLSNIQSAHERRVMHYLTAVNDLSHAESNSRTAIAQEAHEASLALQAFMHHSHAQARQAEAARTAAQVQFISQECAKILAPLDPTTKQSQIITRLQERLLDIVSDTKLGFQAKQAEIAALKADKELKSLDKSLMQKFVALCLKVVSFGFISPDLSLKTKVTTVMCQIYTPSSKLTPQSSTESYPTSSAMSSPEKCTF